MTGQPISIRALRERDTGLSHEHVKLLCFELEALVEAVERAHAVMARPSFHWDNPETLRLRDQLARFTDWPADQRDT